MRGNGGSQSAPAMLPDASERTSEQEEQSGHRVSCLVVSDINGPQGKTSQCGSHGFSTPRADSQACGEDPGLCVFPGEPYMVHPSSLPTEEETETTKEIFL